MPEVSVRMIHAMSCIGAALLLLGAGVVACRANDDHGVRQPPAIVLAADAAPVDAGGAADGASTAATMSQPLFWRLEKDGQTSYLLGTFHGGVDPAALPSSIWEHLAEARTFAMETDISRAAELYRQRRRGKNLKDALGPRYWHKLVAGLGEPRALALVNDIPATAQGALAMRTLPRTQSMDVELRARAEAVGKPLVFLEPLEHQLALIHRWITVRTLRDAIDDASANDQRVQAEVAAYLAGDAAQLLVLADNARRQALARGHSARELDARANALLYRRNAAWIAPIERLHAAGGGFIAVGVAHTIGPRSVIELLERRGFTITRL
jgi:uncharacterized protein YbaP (TraB family)